MRKNNKIAAKAFTFLVCLTLLTGCGNSSGDSKGNGNGGDTQVTATAEPSKDADNKNDDGNKSSEDKSGTDEGKSDSKDTNSSNDNNSSETNNQSGDNNDKSTDSNDQSGSNDASSDVNIPASATFKTISIDYKTKDLETSYVPGDCTSIVFSDNDIKVVGKETEISNVDGKQIVKIIKKGDYLISGSCSNGQIIVEANKEKDVRLILAGLTLSCTDSAPIYEKQCDKMVITLAEGTENVLSDESQYVYEDTEKKQPDAVIFAKDDLVINGNGTLKVDSAYMEGIHSTDSVKLISGNISVRSGDNGVRGKEGVIIKGANLDVTSKGDGIKTTYSDNTSLGYIIIEGGNVKLYTAKDAIQATGHIQISGGTLDITTDNGVAHAGSEDESKSAKGIKSDHDVYIGGGTVNINSSDDGINNNGNIIFDGGSLTVTAFDDGLQSDMDIVINGGSVDVKSTKGIKGKSVSVKGGDVQVNASEGTGIKASSGKDDDEDSKVIFGEDDPFAVDSEVYIAVAGGTVHINAEAGKCLNSDGNLYIAGGKVTIDGSLAVDGGAVSFDGTAFVTGGSIENKDGVSIKEEILKLNNK